MRFLTVALLATLLFGSSACGGDDRRNRSFTMAEIGEEDTTLWIDTFCMSEATTSVIESTDKLVRIRLEVAGDEVDCPDVVSVELDEPLGPRAVVDDRSGERIPVRPAGP